MTNTNPFANDRIDNLEQLEEAGQDGYPARTPTPTAVRTFRDEYETTDEDEFDEQLWTLAGRITRENEFGDFAFYDIDDRTETVQVMCRREDTEEYELLEYVNLGDHVVFTGTPGLSNTGELTLFADEFTVSGKSLTEYSTEWNALGEQQRVEQRTAALATQDDLYDSVQTRFEIQQVIRQQLQSENFLEVETPSLQHYAGGAEATPFETQCEAIDREMALRIAPELYLKRLITEITGESPRL